MKDWYEKAASELSGRLENEEKVNHYFFLEDFVIENRYDLFEDVDFEDIEQYVDDNVEGFYNYIVDNYSFNFSGDGVWGLLNDDKEPFTIDDEVSFTNDEKIILEKNTPELEAIIPDDDFVESINVLYKKLSSQKGRENDLAKFSYFYAKLASRLSSFNDEDLIGFWIRSADDQQDMLDRKADSYKEAAYYSLKALKYKEAGELYLKASEYYKNESDKVEALKRSRVQYQLVDESEKASEVFVQEMDLKKSNSCLLMKFILFIYKKVSLYGESPSRAFFTMMIFIGLFSIYSYFFICDVSYSNDGFFNDRIVDRIFNSIYFSFITFTTLGYGDMLPISLSSRVLSGLFALIGLLNTSLFMITVVRKYSRA